MGILAILFVYGSGILFTAGGAGLVIVRGNGSGVLLATLGVMFILGGLCITFGIA